MACTALRCGCSLLAVVSNAASDHPRGTHGANFRKFEVGVLSTLVIVVVVVGVVGGSFVVESFWNRSWTT